MKDNAFPAELLDAVARRRLTAITALASDLDGTLLGGDGQPPTSVVDALIQLSAAGVPIIAATARPPRERDRILSLNLPLRALIMANGAYIYDCRRAEIVETRLLSHNTVRSTVNVFRAKYKGVAFSAEGIDRALNESGYAPYGVGAAGPWVSDILENESFQPLKLLGRHPNFSAAVLPDILRDLSLLNEHIEVTSSAKIGLVEITAHGAKKETALSDYLRASDIDSSGLVGCGDMPNDAGLLSSCKFRIGPAGARRLLSDVLDIEADQPGAEGVGRLLRAVHVLLAGQQSS